MLVTGEITSLRNPKRRHIVNEPQLTGREQQEMQNDTTALWKSSEIFWDKLDKQVMKKKSLILTEVRVVSPRM